MSIEEILLYLANNNFSYKHIFIFFIFSIIGLSLPIPYTLIIIINVYVFGWIGFFIVILSIPFGSLITFFYVKKFSNLIKKIKFFHRIYNKKINKKIKFQNNIYILILARAYLPFYLTSVAFSLTNISIKKYLYLTIIGTFINTLLMSFIINSIRDSIISYNDVVISWKDPLFILPSIILLLFVFLNKKIKMKLYENNN
jgi:uncharacterized membrane protein YdjX (TVP38/TMEM64 family)|tara:strand:+ start:2123 stop:2719 length:597 start_codon:yes stop_codon:yes gene_type:complete